MAWVWRKDAVRRYHLYLRSTYKYLLHLPQAQHWYVPFSGHSLRWPFESHLRSSLRPSMNPNNPSTCVCQPPNGSRDQELKDQQPTSEVFPGYFAFWAMERNWKTEKTTLIRSRHGFGDDLMWFQPNMKREVNRGVDQTAQVLTISWFSLWSSLTHCTQHYRSSGIKENLSSDGELQFDFPIFNLSHWWFTLEVPGLIGFVRSTHTPQQRLSACGQAWRRPEAVTAPGLIESWAWWTPEIDTLSLHPLHHFSAHLHAPKATRTHPLLFVLSGRRYWRPDKV